ncbi:MAG: class I SAM-dependent methyltransferase [Negativicutes bacterium]
MKSKNNVIKNAKLNFELLLDAAKKPPLFSLGEELFWNDPHISQQMLECHLDPYVDVASRKHKTIDEIVWWLTSYLQLTPGSRVLDIGCGPGLYSTRFYQQGLDVTGMDYSRNSINYAVNYAVENNMNIKYIYQNYLTLDYEAEFDAIFLICCDFGALTDANRNLLLQKIWKALKPGGVFVFDVFTREQRTQLESANWHIYDSGFWRPHQHLVFEQTFYYEEQNVFLNQYNVIEANGESTLYKIWDHCYTPDTITTLLQDNNYLVEAVWSDLAGNPLADGSKTLGIVAKKH